jgi:serine beta-lactamase-like protein LACTB, mitochondrial
VSAGAGRIRERLERPWPGRRPAAVALLWSCVAPSAGAGAQIAELHPAQAAGAGTATAVVEELRKSLDLPALAVAVAVHGEIVVETTLGSADVRRAVPAGPTSLFRIGSVSKLLTATAAVRLHQAGKLDLDAPCSLYLADVPPDKAGITPRQLAAHLSGMRHYGRDDYVNRTHHDDVLECLPALLDQPLLAPPGTAYAYSSYGFNVLGAVLQRAGGADYRAVVREQVLAPLGMLHTCVEDSTSPPADRVALYSRDKDGALVDAAVLDLTDRWPSGGFLSTAGDLVRLGSGVLRSSFLDDEERELLFTSERTADGHETGVGLGWRIGRDARGRRFVHHGGDTMGGRAYLYPDEGVSVALLTNLTFAPLGEKEARELAEPYLHP